MAKFEINENVQCVIDFINRLHDNMESEYIIAIDFYNTLDELKTDCYITLNELFHEGYYNNDYNLRCFHMDMLKG